MTACLAISFGIRFRAGRTPPQPAEGTSWIPSQAENLASVMFTFQVFDFFFFLIIQTSDGRDDVASCYGSDSELVLHPLVSLNLT
jgi:hypothetical protein